MSLGAGEDVISLGEVIESEPVRHELAGGDLAAGQQPQQRRRRGRIDQAGGDGDVPGPLILQVQRGGLAVHADIGDAARQA